MMMKTRPGKFRDGNRLGFISVIILTLILVVFAGASAVALEGNYEQREVDIWSDGTRLSGDLFYPSNIKKGQKLPAIIMSHGWGGLKSHLNTAYAPYFAEAGYVVLTFDYRGWGESDSRLVLIDEMPEPNSDGEITVTVQAIRQLVDPLDQSEDIINAINYIVGEPIVDPKRIGLWGSSFSGGLVLNVALKDPRVKCITTQVGSMDSSWPNLYYNIKKRNTQRARGEIDPVPQGFGKVKGLTGTPHLEHMAEFNPAEHAGDLKVPILIIEAEKEELMKPEDHGLRVYNAVKDKVPAKRVVLPITHYQIYSGRYKKQAIALQIEWYDKYLKGM
jgi:dipeptidyl aminopeptidase/acylaminoacyl peptidase